MGRRGGPIAIAVGGVVAAGLLVYVFVARNRADLSAFWQLVVAVVALAVALVPLIRERRAGPAPDGATRADRLADALATAVLNEWTAAATERSLLSPRPIDVRWSRVPAVAGSPEAAATSTRFGLASERGATQPCDLYEGGLDELHTISAGLGSGRLVIVGGPGSGKSAAAVLLVVAAARERSGFDPGQRRTTPVTVLFTVAGWDPRMSMRDWLVARLCRSYQGIFAGYGGPRAAAELVDAGRLTLVLDGFDELPEPQRPLALHALDQLGVRVVLLSRYDEMVAAARRTRLAGATAVRLDDVGPGEAANYLERVQLDPPPPGWETLLGILRGRADHPLKQALTTPLRLTLVRDTYDVQDDGVDELLRWCASTQQVAPEDIEQHLLDRVLPHAYRELPGRPLRYDLATARRTLGVIATRMAPDAATGGRNLAWWRIPAWTAALPRAVVTGAAVWLLVSVGLWSAVGFRDFGAVLQQVGAIVPLGGVLGALSARGGPARPVPTRWDWVLSRPQPMLVLGAVFGFLAQPALSFAFPGVGGTVVLGGGSLPEIRGANLVVLGVAAAIGTWALRGRNVPRRRSASAFAAGLVLGDALGVLSVEFLTGDQIAVELRGVAAVALALGLRIALGGPAKDLVSPLVPNASWTRGSIRALVVWTVLGLSCGVLTVLPAEWNLDILANGLGFLAGLVLGLIVPERWTSSLAFVELAVRHRTPFRLMLFLDDARERGVLRTVGPLYQFRHARLQDRLAAPTPAGGGSVTRAPWILGRGAAAGIAVWLGVALLVTHGFPGALPGLLFGVLAPVGGVAGAWLAARRPRRGSSPMKQTGIAASSLSFGAGALYALMFAPDVVGVAPAGYVGSVVFGFGTGFLIWLTMGVVIWIVGRERNPTAFRNWRDVRLTPALFGFVAMFAAMAYALDEGITKVTYAWSSLVVALAVLVAVLTGLLRPRSRDERSPLPARPRSRGVALLAWFVAGGLGAGALVRVVIAASSFLPIPDSQAAGIGLLAVYGVTAALAAAAASLLYPQRNPAVAGSLPADDIPVRPPPVPAG